MKMMLVSIINSNNIQCIVVSSYRRIVVSSYHRIIVSSYRIVVFLLSLPLPLPLLFFFYLSYRRCASPSAFLPFYLSSILPLCLDPACLPFPLCCIPSWPIIFSLLYSLFPAPLSLSLVSCSLPNPSLGPGPRLGLEAFSFSHQNFFLSLPTHIPTRCTFITMSSSSLLRLQESFVGPLKIKFRMF